MSSTFKTHFVKKIDTVNGVRVEIIIPTLNEEGTIAELLRSIRSQALPEVSTVVVDGGSQDRTIEICEKERVRIIKQKGKGKGNAMIEAVEQTDADIVVFIDGDGTYSISDLELLIEPILIGQADMVVGSRVLGKKEKGSIPAFNSFGNKLFNNTINFFMKSHLTDSLSGYRAVRKDVFRELVLFSTDFEIEVEMTLEALIKGYRVIEVPVKYGTRKGTTKLHPLHDGIKIARTLLFIIMNSNPLKFFGIMSVLFFIAGLYPATQVVYEKILAGHIITLHSVVFTSLLFMAAILSLIAGLVSELIVRSRRRLEYLVSKKSW